MEDGDHEQVTYDLSEWTEDQRRALDLMLMGAEIPYGWGRGHPLVPRRQEADVDDLIEVIEPGEVVEDLAELAMEASHLEDVDQPDLASPGRGLLGFMVDGILLSATSFVIGNAVLHLDSSSPIALRLLLPALVAGYEILTTAKWGRTLGKLAAGTRVVALADGSIPGWRRASVRWAVPVGPTFVTFWVPGGAPTIIISGLIGSMWMVIVYGGVLWNALQQGLHDKAAGTVVIVADRSFLHGNRPLADRRRREADR